MDSFWLNNPRVLLLFPQQTNFKKMSLVEKVNTIAIIGLYLSVILTIYNSDPKYLLISISTFCLSYFIYNNRHISENFQNEISLKKISPTKMNPFMNPIPSAKGSKYNEEPVDSVSMTPEAKQVRKEIEDNFNVNLYRDVSDVFETNNSRRQFYTVPRNNGSIKYLLYGNMKSGKEDQYHNGSKLHEDLSSRPQPIPKAI